MIVIKVGTNSIVENGKINRVNFNNLVRQIAELKKSGHKVILVSSGAVGIARAIMNSSATDKKSRQILASIGQPLIMHEYSTAFAEYNISCAQLLLTKYDFQSKTHCKNIKAMLNKLLHNDALMPIINENDSVAIDESVFSDNDELAGLLSAHLNVQRLIILTNVDGVYSSKPTDPCAVLIKEINARKSGFLKVSKDKSSSGRGGMFSKISTAFKVARIGVKTHIVNGSESNVITRLITNRECIGTLIKPKKKESEKKRWLAFISGKEIAGKIIFSKNNKKIVKLFQSGVIFDVKACDIHKTEGNLNQHDAVYIYIDKKKIGAGIITGTMNCLESVLIKGKDLFINY